MTKKPRKLRSDSNENAIRIFACVNTTLNPPAHVPLTHAELPFWRSILAECATADWSEHQLEVAALLARTMAELNAQQQILRSEGTLIVRSNGNTVVNCRNAIVSRLTGQVFAYRRSLCLTMAKLGRRDDATRRREFNRRLAEEARSSGEDLLS